MVNFWAGLGIQKKIFAGLAMILLLMACAFAIDLRAQRVQASLAESLISRLLPARAGIRTVKRLIITADDAGAWFLLGQNTAQRRPLLAHYRSDLAQVDRWLREARHSQNVPAERVALDRFARVWTTYRNGNDAAFRLSLRDRTSQARVAYVRVPYAPLLNALGDYERAIQVQIDRARARYAFVRTATMATVASLNVAALVLATIIGIGLGGSLRHRLSAVSSALAALVRVDLAHIAESFRNIAAGDLSFPRYTCTREPIEVRGSDELAQLAASYNGLITGMHEMAQRIDHSVLEARRRREAEEQLEYLQDYDPLTGLANRHLLHAQLNHAIYAGFSSGESIAVAYLGVLGFKKVEDSYGRTFAEKVLTLAAQRLKYSLGRADLAARSADDEFIVLLAPVQGERGARDRVRQIMDVLGRPFELDEREIVFNVSAGVSIYPSDGRDADELLRNANTAMSYAKQSGPGEVTVYAPVLRTRSLDRLTIESELQRAITASEFELHYQPIVDVGPHRITSFEALLRWRHPRLGLLGPEAFIDIAEDSNTIEAMGEWVLQSACAQAQQWRQVGHDVGVSVNVSVRQFRGDVFGVVQRALAQTNYPAPALELELTESLMLTGPGAIDALVSLKRLGVRLAIDDFGTGYSSLSYLRQFPLDTLKIDRSFVSEITVKTFDEAIARAIILLGHSLGVRVIAEGVEDAAQAATLRRLGCDAMQGYYFGRPLPANAVMDVLQASTMSS
ncbi:MAG TPA: EAL domain-containing protein [Candidatus Baltobacteraceae bacterium]